MLGENIGSTQEKMGMRAEVQLSITIYDRSLRELLKTEKDPTAKEDPQYQLG